MSIFDQILRMAHDHPTVKNMADKIGIDDRPFSCCNRSMMLVAFSKAGIIKIELIVKTTLTVVASRQ